MVFLIFKNLFRKLKLNNLIVKNWSQYFPKKVCNNKYFLLQKPFLVLSSWIYSFFRMVFLPKSPFKSRPMWITEYSSQKTFLNVELNNISTKKSILIGKCSCKMISFKWDRFFLLWWWLVKREIKIWESGIKIKFSANWVWEIVFSV